MAAESRIGSLRRLLFTTELLRQLRYGASILEIQQELGFRMGRPYCKRTHERDIALLEELGFVRRNAKPGIFARYIWVDQKKPFAELPPAKLLA